MLKWHSGWEVVIGARTLCAESMVAILIMRPSNKERHSSVHCKESTYATSLLSANTAEAVKLMTSGSLMIHRGQIYTVYAVSLGHSGKERYSR